MGSPLPEGIVAVVKADCPTCRLLAPGAGEEPGSGVEVDRLMGWSRPQWEKFTGVEALGDGLPEHRPGCGSLTVDPAVIERLAARSTGLRSRRLELARLEDEAEAFF